MLAAKDGNLTAVIWDFEQPDQKVSNRPFYTRVVPARPAAPVQLQVTHLMPSTAYSLEVHRTGYHTNDAYSAYIEMGSPKDLTTAQIAQLNKLTQDLPHTDQVMHSGPDGTIEITIPMNSNDIVLVNLNRSREENERSNSR
jgi:xylan 1,4-beta-xylosidase